MSSLPPTFQKGSKKERVFFDDDPVRLRARVASLKSRHNHREYPSSRTRHFITNVRINLAGEVILVTSSFLVYRFRMGDTSPYVAWYEHRLKHVDGKLKIHHERAVLDVEALESTELSTSACVIESEGTSGVLNSTLRTPVQ